MKALRLPKLAMSEEDLLTAVLELAEVAGFRRVHFRPLRTAKTRLRKRDGKAVPVWVTATQGNKGWPDIALAGRGRFFVVELKDATGTLDDDQARWRLEIEAAGVQYFLWRPADWCSGAIAKAFGCEGYVVGRLARTSCPLS